MQATRERLDAQRWHLQHGPIDLVIEAHGDAGAVAAAHESAWARFGQVLGELVAELPVLREPVKAGGACPLHGAVARRMWAACRPYATGFITPMAAVAGAVAEAIVASYARPGVTRAWVNNGGDAALHLAPGSRMRIGLYADLARLATAGRDRLDGSFEIDAAMPARGVATSGWRGRSFSMGVADSVTVLAASAAAADAAATVIANAVDVPDPAIVRRPASALKDDTDLGDRLVTVDVPALAPPQVARALDAGAAVAHELCDLGLVVAAALVCQGARRVVGMQSAGVPAPAGAAPSVMPRLMLAAFPQPLRRAVPAPSFR